MNMTAAQYRAIIQGKINRAQGLSFEELIEASCVHYKTSGAAFIEKTPEPMRVLAPLDRKKGIFKAIFQKAAQPDFKGTLKGGRGVVFEAKHTQTDRIQQDAVTKEQRDAMDAHEAMGALCFVLVGLEHKFYRVPWNVWKSMKELFGHKYMNTADMAGYEVQYMRGILHFLEQPPENQTNYEIPTPSQP